MDDNVTNNILFQNHQQLQILVKKLLLLFRTLQKIPNLVN